VPDRPALIGALEAAGLRYYETDYTAFESHFDAEFMSHVECELFRHCLSWCPDDAELLIRTDCGVNSIRTRFGLAAQLKARRMSGDLWTSLGNGWTNYILTKFVVEEMLGKTFNGFFEGDDGLVATEAELRPEHYERLGFTITMSEVRKPGLANFCGMKFAAEGEIIREPRDFLNKFGWTMSMLGHGPKVGMELLRAKALSATYETPQCPIVGVLARVALERTRGSAARYVDDGYHKAPPDEFKLEMFHPSAATRALFQESFGVTVAEQLRVEELIRQDRLSEIHMHLEPHPHVAEYTSAWLQVT
jgi:hypothetical protein